MPGLRPVAGRSPRVRRHAGRSHCYQWVGNSQPAQGFEPNLQRFFVGHPLAAEDERLAHACVIIGDAGFKPWPVLRGAFVPKLHKFSSQCLAHRVDVRITREVSKILVDTE